MSVTFAFELCLSGAPRFPVMAGRSFPAAESEIVDVSFTDLIACERDCRSCSYAAWLDCDGDCGPCPHNSYCPCVNPVVARSKTALKILELRPKLLQDLQART